MTDTAPTKHVGDLSIERSNAARYSGLVEVTGSITILSDVTMDALTSVGGVLYLWGNTNLNAPALTGVGGGLDLWPAATLNAPALSSVGGRLRIVPGANLNAQALISVGGHLLPSPALADARIRAVAAAALAPDALSMEFWHACDTTHCIAGWGIHQAGDAGYALQEELGAATAGVVLLGLEAAHHFYDSDADARAWLQSKLARAVG